jgi:hypothetical protein
MHELRLKAELQTPELGATTPPKLFAGQKAPGPGEFPPFWPHFPPTGWRRFSPREAVPIAFVIHVPARSAFPSQPIPA